MKRKGFAMGANLTDMMSRSMSAHFGTAEPRRAKQWDQMTLEEKIEDLNRRLGGKVDIDINPGR